MSSAQPALNTACSGAEHPCLPSRTCPGSGRQHLSTARTPALHARPIIPQEEVPAAAEEVEELEEEADEPAAAEEGGAPAASPAAHTRSKEGTGAGPSAAKKMATSAAENMLQPPTIADILLVMQGGGEGGAGVGACHGTGRAGLAGCGGWHPPCWTAWGAGPTATLNNCLLGLQVRQPALNALLEC